MSHPSSPNTLVNKKFLAQTKDRIEQLEGTVAHLERQLERTEATLDDVLRRACSTVEHLGIIQPVTVDELMQAPILVVNRYVTAIETAKKLLTGESTP